MTFNLFGGFKFAGAFKVAAPVYNAPAAPACAPASAPAAHGGLFGNLFDIKSQLLGHVAGDLGHAAGGLANAGHSLLDNLLHHDDKDDCNDSHGGHGNHGNHGNHGGHDNHGGHGNHGDDHCGSGHSGGGTGGGSNAGNDFPPIPGDTLGVTFSVDLDGDGVNDEYAVVKAPDNPTAQDQTLQHYYDQVAKDLAESHPDLPANQIVVKATIYSASQGESYYHFNGDETTTEEQDAENDKDHHGDPDYDHNHEHEGHEHEGHDHDHASNDHGSDDQGSGNHSSDDGHNDCGSAEGDHDSNFYSHLMSWTAGSHDDKEPAPEHDDDSHDENHDHDLHFC
jgi:hypothetical protein